MVEPTGLSLLPLLAKFIGPLMSSAGKSAVAVGSDQWDKYTGKLDSYLQMTIDRHKYFSSAVFSNEGKLLEDYYLPLSLHKLNASLFTAEKAAKPHVLIDGYPADLFNAYHRILVVDTAGMGKSTLLKYIFLKTIESKESIPVFIELRRLSANQRLEKFLLKELAVGDKQNKPFFNKCLANGIFTFLLDGFDEVTDENKAQVSQDILSLMEKAPRSKFLLSSREESSLGSLGQFHRFHIVPLSQEEAFSLIRKLVPGPEIGNSLIEKIRNTGPELHEFLQNPLLVSLLVRSFIHSPILPVHLSEFYRQVFDALYQTHDSKKELGGYSRPKKSALNLDRFHKALRALGMITYKAGKLEYSRDELLRNIDDSKVLMSDNSFESSDFCDDLLRAVPLFVLEGQRLRWAHRSLQEYFAAAYICTDAKENQKQILLSIYDAGAGSIQHNSNLLRLCVDMDAKTFQETLVQKFVTDVLAYFSTSYKPQDFPSISSLALDERRYSTFDASYALHVVDPKKNQKTYLSENQDKVLSPFKVKAVEFVIPLTSNFEHFDEDKHKKIAYYLVRCRARSSTVLFYIMSVYLDRPCIFGVHGKARGKRFKNLTAGESYLVSDAADSPLNSFDNFETTTKLILRYQFVVDEQKCRDLLDEINQNIRKAGALQITF